MKIQPEVQIATLVVLALVHPSTISPFKPSY